MAEGRGGSREAPHEAAAEAERLRHSTLFAASGVNRAEAAVRDLEERCTGLAVLENAVRIAVRRGATETEVRDAVGHGLRTPEGRS